jgi:hypothetical protein
MFLDGFTMCDKHWGQFCDIDLPEDPTYAEMQRYERRKLEFAIKCQFRRAEPWLRRLKEDPDNYVPQFIGNGDSDKPARTFRQIWEDSERRRQQREAEDVEPEEEPSEEPESLPVDPDDPLAGLDDLIADGTDEPDDFHDRIADGVAPFGDDDPDDDPLAGLDL